MLLKPPFLTGSALLLSLALLLVLEPPRLQAQGDIDFDSIFQAPPQPGHLSGTPPLPPSATDPFALPPAGSIPLGSASPPLTSPAISTAEPLDDPFGTPAPDSRQVRQVGPAPAPEASEVQDPVTPTVAPAPLAAAPSLAVPAAAPAASAGARQTLDEAQRAKYRALFPDMFPPADQSVSALTTPALAAPEQAAEDGPAIGRAGSLLTQEYYGQAKVLPPLDLPPAQEEAAVAPAPKAKAPAQPTAQPKAKAPKGGQGSRPPAPAALPRGSLALVNETGDPQVGAIYQSALSRLGYTVLPGPAGGFSPGSAGQPARSETVIYYRPGTQARAQAVSRDLPGRKTMAEAPPGAAADIVIVLR